MKLIDYLDRHRERDPVSWNPIGPPGAQWSNTAISVRATSAGYEIYIWKTPHTSVVSPFTAVVSMGPMVLPYGAPVPTSGLWPGAHVPHFVDAYIPVLLDLIADVNARSIVRRQKEEAEVARTRTSPIWSTDVVAGF